MGTRCHTPFAKYMKELLPSKLEFHGGASIHHTLLVLDYCHCLFIVTLLTSVFLIVLVVPKHPYLLTSLKSHFQVNTSKFQISFKMVSITATLLTTLLPFLAAAQSSTTSSTTYPVPTLLPAPYLNQTTVYTTVYVDVCPTGLTTKTYTITQTCATPEHFTTTTKVCDACAGKPTLTVTCPIETAAATATGNATSVVAVPTGTAGCGSGGSCPAGGNGTVIYVTAGAEGRFVTGLEVLVLGAMVGAASSILLL